jgi:eukaryotic-like serine/threonine-protein kinase
VPAEVCAGSRTSTTRTPICWKTVGYKAKPWAGGVAFGALAVGLLWTFSGPAAEPKPEPLHEPEPVAGALVPGEELTRKLDDPKTTEIALAPGSFDFSAVLPNKRQELVVNTTGPTRLVLAANPGPNPKFTLPGEGGAVWALTYMGRNQLVMGLENGTVKTWDLTTGEGVKTFVPHASTVWSAETSADGKYLLTACDDSSVSVWSPDKPETKPVKLPHGNSVRAAVFSPNGKFIATGDRNSTVRVWDWGVGQIPVELVGHSGAVYALAYSPDGTRLASAGSDAVVRVWNLAEINWNTREGPTTPLEMREHKGSVYGVAFSPDGSKIASAGWDGVVRIWDARKGTQIRPLKTQSFDVWSVSFGNDGKWVAGAGSDGYVRVWEVDTGKEVFSYHGAYAFHVVRFAPDGTTLAAGSRDGTVRVWEVKK